MTYDPAAWNSYVRKGKRQHLWALALMKLAAGCPYVAVMKDHSEYGFNLWAMSLKDNRWSTSKCSLSLCSWLWRMAQRFRNDRLLFYFALDKWQGLQLCPRKAWQDQMERIGRGLWDVLLSGQHDFIPFMNWSASISKRLPHDRLNSWKRQRFCNQLVLILPDCFANNPFSNSYMPMGEMSQNIVCRKIERALNWCWMLK